MFYLFIIFFILVYYKRDLPLFHPFILSLTLLPFLYYFLMLIDIRAPSYFYLDVLSLCGFAIFMLYRSAISVKHLFIKSNNQYDFDRIMSLLIVLFFICGFIFLFSPTFLLPGCDPVSVPTLAKLVYVSGNIPKTLEPLSEEIFSYPPSFCVLTSIFYTFDNPLLVLWIFKYINVLLPPLIPALMAYYFNRLYNFNSQKFYKILLCFYFGFFLLDRTLFLALPFAGKNAVQYGIFLFPVVFYGYFKENRTYVDKAIAAFSIVGLILVHYSFLFMFTTLAFFHLLINCRLKSRETLWLFTTFLCAVALFIPFYLHLKNAAFITIHMEGASLSLAWDFFKQTFFSLNDHYSDYLFGMSIKVNWNYKKLLLLLMILFFVGFFWIKKRGYKQDWDSADRAILKASLVNLLSFIASVLFGCFLFIKPIFHIEYIRWYIHIYYSLFASFFMICISMIILKLNNSLLKRMSAVALFLIFPIVTSLYFEDVKRIRWLINIHKIPYSTVRNLKNTLDKLSTQDTITNLITESSFFPIMGWYITVQTYLPLDYSPMLSNCRILNGSWLILPFEKSRDIDNLPSDEFYSSIESGPIYFVVKEETMKQYLNKVNSVSATKLDLKIEGFPVYHISKK